MTGVVLCGGQSTRMGTDKGLLRLREKTWAEHAADKLASLQIPVVVSVNIQQLNAYSKIFHTEELIIDDENLSLKGPLLGLMSVHQQMKQEDLFVLACDISEMNTALLQNLNEIYKRETAEAYVYATGEKPQPLCAIYTSAALNKIEELYQQQQLKKFSMMHVLECIETKHIPVLAAVAQYFNNYNSPEDVETNIR